MFDLFSLGLLIIITVNQLTSSKIARIFVCAFSKYAGPET